MNSLFSPKEAQPA